MRIYEAMIREGLEQGVSMFFLCGPGRVGKTALAKALAGEEGIYMNWEKEDDRRSLVADPAEILARINGATGRGAVLILDGVHKGDEWDRFFEKMYGMYKEIFRIIVIGDFYERESELGAVYRVHPFSMGERLNWKLTRDMFRRPEGITDIGLERFLRVGGFPEVFCDGDREFVEGWRHAGDEGLMQEVQRYIKDASMSSKVEDLMEFIRQRSGEYFDYSDVAEKTKMAELTVRGWTEILEREYYCYKLCSWSDRGEGSLLGKAKYYLWDWSRVEDMGARIGNFVASHLLKAVDFWNDTGRGEYGLFFVEGEGGDDVDFLVVQDGEPWMLCDVRISQDEPLSEALLGAKEELNPEYVFSLRYDMAYTGFDIRELKEPRVVSMRTFLSQLP